MAVMSKIARYISNAGAVLSGVGLFIIMAGTALDGLGRYLFRAPITGLIELSEPVLAASVFLGLAWTERLHRHVRVDIITVRLSRNQQMILRLLSQIVVILFVGIMGYFLLRSAIISYGLREAVYGVVPIPIWWAKFSISIGCFMLCLQCVCGLCSREFWSYNK